MAIRIVSRLVRRGALGSRLGDVTAQIDCTNVPPTNSTGTFNVQLGQVTAVIAASVSATPNRSGALVATLGNVTAVMSGTSHAPG